MVNLFLNFFGNTYFKFYSMNCDSTWSIKSIYHAILKKIFESDKNAKKESEN